MTATALTPPPASTSPPAPPPGQHPVPPPPRAPRRRRVVAFAVSLGLLVSSTIGAAFLPTPYLTLRPGMVRPVTDQILVEGVESHPPEHSIAYTTVSVGRATLLEALVGWLDDDVDVVPEEQIRGGRDAEESRRYNAQLMDTSKLVATVVALERLGYDAEVRTTGAVVRQIAPDTPTAEVLELDDVIVAVDDEPIDDLDDLRRLLQVGGPGATHRLTVERPPGGDVTVDLDVTTAPAPDDPERAIIGVVVEDRIVGVDLPFEVLIDSGTVGGPSAGLAFTLALLDVLTPGELTGGHRVATTGTIALDGTVGPVGGAAQKAVGVRNAGYEVFLVPHAEVDEVRAVVGDDLTVIGVGTLDEALEALESLGGDVRSLEGAAAGS